MSKKNIIIAIVAILLLIAVVGAIVFFVQNGKNDSTNTENDTTNVENEALAELELDTVSTEGVALSFMKLSASSPVMAAASGDYLSTQITATVLPADAPDKTVDWSVAWASDATRAGSDVANYVTVVPTSDGSNVATVYCHQAFTGDYIYITVTTRTGGYTATARCQYVGYPETLVIDKTGYTSVTDSDWNANIVEVDCGNTYYFDLNLDNTLGVVGSNFGDYKISMTTYGGITTTQNNYDSTGALTGTITGEQELVVADTWDSDGSVYSYYAKTGGLHIAISCSIENGQLVVEAKDAASAYSWTTGSRAGSATCKYTGYIDGMEPYTAVTVTDTVSGVSTTINIRTLTTVSSVSVNGGEDIIF
ncbi:MAG: hypothetical protein J6D20_00595 [Clostridia bacterium]|nr:hypothetical protein [Clostridia bacterium]